MSKSKKKEPNDTNKPTVIQPLYMFVQVKDGKEMVVSVDIDGRSVPMMTSTLDALDTLEGYAVSHATKHNVRVDLISYEGRRVIGRYYPKCAPPNTTIH